MAKKVVAIIKLALPAGKATPAPPVGPALGQHGLNIAGFCKVLQKVFLVDFSSKVIKRPLFSIGRIHSN